MAIHPSSRSRGGHRSLVAVAAALVLGALLSRPTLGAGKEVGPAPGSFLVAAESMGDPRFREAVILLLRHDRGGSVGLIVNRPTPIPLARVIPEAEGLEGSAEAVWFGGPVAKERLLVLLRSNRPPRASARVFDDVFVTGVGEVLDRLGGSEAIRVFVGYAGWAPGQLEAEISRGDWTVGPADDRDIFDRDPEAVWPRRRQAENRIFI